MLSKTFDRKLMLDLLICISEDVKKNLFFAGVRKKTGLSHSGVGGAQKVTDMFRAVLAPWIRSRKKYASPAATGR